MRMQEIKAVQRAEPFRPFIVHVADGRSFRVKHPEFLSISPSGRTVIVYGEDDSLDILDGALLTGIELPNGKGQASRPRKKS